MGRFLVIRLDNIVTVYDNDGIGRGLDRCMLEGVCMPEFGRPLLNKSLKAILVIEEFQFSLFFPVDEADDGSEDNGSSATDDRKREDGNKRERVKG